MVPNDTIQDRLSGDIKSSREIFLEEAFELPQEKSKPPQEKSERANDKQNDQQQLPVDDRPSRVEFINFLHDLTNRYDSHKDSWQYYLNRAVEGSDRMSPSVDREALQRAEKDPSWSPSERKWLDIVKRNYDTSQYLNPYNGSTFDGTGINYNRIDAILDLDLTSERNENIKTCAQWKNAKSLGIRGIFDPQLNTLKQECGVEYDTIIKPKIEQLLNDLRTEPSAELLALARGGNAEAQRQVALYYLQDVDMSGFEELSEFDSKQLTRSMPWLYASAGQGNKDALYTLARTIGESMFGQGSKATEVVGKFFEEEARKGDKGASSIAQDLKQGLRNEVAAKLYIKAAEQENDSAVTMVGLMAKGFNLRGHALKVPLGKEAQQECIRALKTYSDQGKMNATVTLGELYELGTGVPRDGKKAEQLYRKAAEAGNRDGMLHMGIINYEGDIVNKNFEESAKWFKQAGDIVEWKLGQMLNHEMGRGSPPEVWAEMRKDAETLPEDARRRMLELTRDERKPFDPNMIRFAEKAAAIKSTKQ